jgi:hypothetical protein
MTMIWVGHITRIAEMKNAYKILVGKPEGKRSAESCRHRWNDNLKRQGRM